MLYFHAELVFSLLFALVVQFSRISCNFESFDSKLRIDQLPSSTDLGNHSLNQSFAGSSSSYSTFDSTTASSTSESALNSTQITRSNDSLHTFNLTALFGSNPNSAENANDALAAPKNSTNDIVSSGQSNRANFVSNTKPSASSSNHGSSGACEPISIPMCKGIGYNLTRMPNQLNQDTQEEAGLEVHQFWPLVEIKCSEDLRLFLCSMYVPLCIEDYTGYIPVCRSVCERARKGCEPVMAQYRFSWPDRMNCDQLPVFGGDSLCMDERLQNGQLSFDEQFARTLDSDDEEDNESSQVPPPPSSSTSSTLGGGNRPVGGGQVAGTMFDLFGDKEPVDSSEHERPIRPTIVVSTSRPNTHRKSNRKHRPGHRRPTSNVHWKAHNFSLTGRGMSSPFDRLPAFDLLPSDHCKCECRAPFLAIDTRRVFGRHGGQEIRTGGQSNCAFPCHSPYFTKTEEHSANFWITCFSAVCALCTLLTLATFISDPGRFRYPERCIIFLSACYLMVSCGFLLRHLVGHERVACDSPPDSHLSWTLIRYENTGQIPTNCLLIFWLLYFFGMCASLWWVMLTLTWFLAAALKWSSEAIDSYSQYFHLIAWFTPAVKSILIVSSGAIDGEPFTGICYVGSLSDTNLLLFVIIPLCVYLFVGCLFLISGFVSLFRIRSALRQQSRGKTDKLEKLMLRIVVFSVLYIVPGVVVIGCNLYEYWNRDRWATAHNCACNRPSIRYSSDVLATDHHRPLVDSSERPLYFVFLLKYIMCLGVGITSGFWIFSRKTIRSWARFYGRCCCCGTDCAEDKRSQINNRAPPQMHRQSSNSVTAALMAQPAASLGSHQAMGSMSMANTGQSGSQIMSSASQVGHARSYKQLLQQQQLQQHQMQQFQHQQQQQFATNMNLGLVGFGSVSSPRTGSNSGSSISHAKLPLSHV